MVEQTELELLRAAYHELHRAWMLSQEQLKLAELRLQRLGRQIETRKRFAYE